MLPKIAGIRIDARKLPIYTWNADLVAYDGPLISLFRNAEGDDSLFVWLDKDQIRHRWAVIDISRDILQAYLTQEHSLLDIFKSSSTITVFDSTASIRKSNVIRTTWEKLPTEYLPKDDSYLSLEIATKEARNLLDEKVTDYEINIDGELYLEDLSSIPRVYQQLYSFHYGLEHLDRLAIRNALTQRMNSWSGGFSAVHLFSGLREVTPSIHRAKLKSLYYNSPGSIRMELLPKMAQKIKLVATEVLNNFGDAEELYSGIYKFFRENKISGFEDEKKKIADSLTREQRIKINSYVAEFLILMKWDNYKETLLSLDVDSLSQLRTLLAYYRRLRKILIYIEKGKVQL